MNSNQLLTQLAQALGAFSEPKSPTRWDVPAFRFENRNLQPIDFSQSTTLDQLQGIERQKNALLANTKQYLAGLPCNHALLTGARGNGKSSLVAAVLNELKDEGLRLIEVAPADLADLPYLMQLIKNRPEKFIVFCDDLSFKDEDQNTRALKSRLEGSLDSPETQVLIYATSNRRHLLPQRMQDNLQTLQSTVDQEINAQEPLDERLSLAERFGLWLSFVPMDQALYLDIVKAGVMDAGFEWVDELRVLSLRFATQRGNRSGRIAKQFTRQWLGRELLEAGIKKPH